MASVPDPEHVKPWYLRNITEALALDEASGNVYVRTGFVGNIIISGNVNIPGNVQVYSTPENPVHTHITEVGTTGILDVPYLPIGGNVIVSSGNINANVTQGTDPWRITGNVNANVSGSVVVTSGNINSNVSGNVVITSGNINSNVTGNVVVTSGNINANVSGNIGVTGNVNIGTMPAITGNVNANITGGNVNANVSGSVTVSSGNINANVTQGTSPWVITGNANIINTPNVWVTNTPDITGNVRITSGNVNANVSGSIVVSSGNINANVSGNVGIIGNVNVTQGTDPWHIDGNVLATISGTPTFTLGTGTTDAFGRLRTSQPYTLFDSRARYYDHNDFSSSTSTGANVVYDANSSTYQLNVTAANGSSVIRETKRVFPYQPGKSLLVLTTFCMNTPKTNLRQRVGYFTTNNGIYFENDGTYNYLVIRSYSSGALVEDRIRQDAWDNPFLALQVNRTQIFWTDIEWLGVGSVRCGFVINGAYVLCHTFHHANITGNTTTYMTTAILPVRYEITNTAGTTGVSMMRQICSTVISEGGYNAFTYSETAGRGTSVLRLASAGTYYPLVSIRLASTRLDAIVLPRQVDVLSPTVNYYRWKLVLNPTLTNANWAGTSTSGTVEYDTAATAMSGGIELQAGYVSSRELSELGADAFAFQLGRTLAGVSDIVTLAMAATSNNADVLAQIGWQEIT
jgi:hypothetical protein